MNPFEMVVMIVAITAVAGVLRARCGHKGERFMGRDKPDPDAERLRDEVRSLKERVAVLERVITDQSSTSALDREFEKLKQMD